MNYETMGSRVSGELIEKQHTKISCHGFNEGHVLTMQLRRKQSNMYTDMHNLADRKS
jgi:hypothetical protein